ncbi:homocysteine S-methyltransferase [Nocardioides guangzhouensis]|uniref:Homocysteine S-methyltransferase n=1 Tax=Nocardioides guangzhouensis TaxID=2497878 RepID=A0A4Q4ZIL8_9ACTN|nr:homocysteine S-methyltransferase [Nocardioides guangzhouensis]RYP88063.1 homocysteine S-methyltransferase [Nocardioides guangzhouensis]
MTPAPHETLADGSRAVVLDGGLSNALEERGQDLSGALWTAGVLRDRPEDVAAVHRAYYEVGARVATTASYQMSVPSLTAAGAGRAEAEGLLGRSVTVARAVRDALAADGVRRWVAASVGPYGAVLADGSEYRGRYGLGFAALRDFHLPRLEVLAAAGPDLLAVETIPDVDEVAVLAGLLDEIGLPAWVSLSIDGDRTRAGQPLADALAVAAAPTCVVAVGVNCCAPGDVLPAVELAVATGKPAVVYPNSGEDWDATARDWTGGSSYDVALAVDWVRAGAAYVGGCCRVGADQVAALAASIARHG